MTVCLTVSRMQVLQKDAWCKCHMHARQISNLGNRPDRRLAEIHSAKYLAENVLLLL